MQRYGAVCPCHGVPTIQGKAQRYCAVKRRATWRRGTARYTQTAQGAANVERNRKRRVFIAHDYHSRADTPERAQAINAHIRSRLREHCTRQSSGKETEGVS